MSSTPLNKTKDKQKPMESHKKKHHRPLEEESLEHQNKPWSLGEEGCQGEAREAGCCFLLQSKELSLDKNSLLRLIDEGQLCPACASLPDQDHSLSCTADVVGREKRMIIAARPCRTEPSSLRAMASPAAEPGSTVQPALTESSFSILLKQRSEIQAKFHFRVVFCFLFLLLVTK